MAIASDTLLEESKCYLCLGISQANALQLALLNRIAGGSSLGYYFLEFYGGWPAGAMSDLLANFFFGDSPHDLRATTDNTANVKIPTSGTLTEFYLKVFLGTNGTGENVAHTILLNGVTSLGPLNLAYNPASGSVDGLLTGLTGAAVAGQTIVMRTSNPNWTVNPLGVRYYGRVKIVL